MPDLSNMTWIVFLLASLFAASALVHFTAPRPLRDAYRRWNYPRGFPVVTGILEIATAALLASPDLRLWGVALGGIILFFATVTLLHHRQYLWAVPSIAMMLALAPAARTAAEPSLRVQYMAETPATLAAETATSVTER
jgi:hypothetical protein